MNNTDFVGLTADFKMSQWLTADGLWTRADEVPQSGVSKVVNIAMGKVKNIVAVATLVVTATTVMISQSYPLPRNAGTSEQSSQIGILHKDAESEIAALKSHIRSLHERLKADDRTGWDSETLRLANEVAAQNVTQPSIDWAEKLIKSQKNEA